MKTRICRTLLLISGLLAAGVAQAGLILDTGVVTFSPTGTQFGRIARGTDASVWGVVKPFPGVTGAPDARASETFTIHNAETQFLQISLDDLDVAFFDSAYINVFSPVNVGPNFGLDTNYLGDPGSSEPFGDPSFFQIVVPVHSTVIINVNEVNPGGGAGHKFDLVVEGFYDANFSDVPEPSSLLLTGGAALFLALFRYRRHKT